MRIAFFERLSNASSPEDCAQTAIGFSLFQLYDTIKTDGFDAQVHGRILELLAADLQRVPNDGPVAGALRSIITALPFWNRDSMRTTGRKAVYESLLQYGKCLGDESEWAVAAEIYGIVGIDAELNGDILASAIARFLCGLASRRCAEWDVSLSSYKRAYELALEAGDFHIALRAKIGEANNIRARGDLSGAERRLHALVAKARALSPDVLSRIALARAGLANSAGRHELAVSLAYDAFRLAGDDSEIRYQVLVDLANLFVDFGLTGPAREALTLVAATAPEKGVRVQAVMNLMWLAMELGNEAEFNELNADIRVSDGGSAYQRTQYELLLVKAFRRFGRLHDARDALGRATKLAHDYRLHQLSFQIEEQATQILVSDEERAIAISPADRTRNLLPPRVYRIASAVSVAVADLRHAALTEA